MKNKSDFHQEPDCNRTVDKQTSMCMGGWYAGEGVEKAGSKYRNPATRPTIFLRQTTFLRLMDIYWNAVSVIFFLKRGLSPPLPSSLLSFSQGQEE